MANNRCVQALAWWAPCASLQSNEARGGSIVLTISQWNKAERREGARLRLSLRLAIVQQQRAGRSTPPICHATTYDVGMSGLSMVIEENFLEDEEVSVLLALPPEHEWASQKVVTIAAEISYAIKSAKANGHKVGLTFREFKGDAKALLRAALEANQKKMEDAARSDAGDASALNLPADRRTLSC